VIVKSDVSTGTLKQARSWLVTVVAAVYLRQGLSLSYSAIVYGRVASRPTLSGAVAFVVLYGVFGVALVVSGFGLLVRIKACLTIAVILAGAYLAGAGTSFVEATFGPTASPMGLAAALVFVAIGCVHYMILRSKSTNALFSQS